jgi:hypothetical protein
VRNAFLIWFEKNYPGMDPEGPNGYDAWTIFQEGFLSGVMYLALALRENTEERKNDVTHLERN